MNPGDLNLRYLVPRDFSFAYRFWHIEPQEPWHEINAVDYPRPPPPSKWKKTGFEEPWREWRTGRGLTEDDVVPRRAISIVWCQPQQSYWILPEDCVGWDEQKREPAEGWHRLQFHDLAGHKGLWQLVEYGTKTQHESTCPEPFKEFLPGQFFSGSSPATPCHLVGRLSLMLGMMAIVPQDPSDIVRQIDEYFYRDHNPRYVPTTEHKKWWPMGRDGKLNIPLL